MKRSYNRMAGILKEVLLGPPGLILVGVLISAIGAFYPPVVTLIGASISAIGVLWSAFQQVGVKRELRRRNDKITELSQNTLNSVIGGDSFCYLELFGRPTVNSELVAVHSGNHPIYDVEARIVDLDKVAQAAEHEEKMKELMGRNFHIGKLAPGSARNVVLWNETVPGQLRLNIFFAARNGTYTQLYRRLRVHDGWATDNRVEHNGKNVLEKISDNFPRDQKGEIDWE